MEVGTPVRTQALAEYLGTYGGWPRMPRALVSPPGTSPWPLTHWASTLRPPQGPDSQELWHGAKISETPISGDL